MLNGLKSIAGHNDLLDMIFLFGKIDTDQKNWTKPG
jgi:hypothetical protein